MSDTDTRKRLNYFKGMFLQKEDFEAEQNYHVEQRQQQNKLLFTPGIFDQQTSLSVSVSTNKTQLTVSPGIAIDQNGRVLILLESDTQPTLARLSQEFYLVISYASQLVDGLSEATSTRIFEKPLIELVSTTDPPDENIKIRLARLTTNASGEVESLNLDVRKAAGVKLAGGLAGLTVAGQDIRNPGNNIELARGGAITLTPDNNNQRITISEDHSTNPRNPHGVTLTQVGTQGGNINGNVRITGNMSIRGNNRLDIQTNNLGTDRQPGATFVWNSAGAGSCGVVAKITTDVDSPIITIPNTPIAPVTAALVGVSGIESVNGVHAIAPSGTHALLVDGTTRINGHDTRNRNNPALFLNGTLSVNGSIVSGHMVDPFINASGQRLQTGDVVKLKGTPIVRFRGPHNLTPLVEVTLADREDDTLVIGIVDCEAFPSPDAPDTRIHPENPTFIEDGGELYLVTLGVFSHCKVDAKDGAIAVGDLLTTSNSPGHAKKATNPKTGSIIGKALEPMEKGIGYIAVFVNIQ